MADCERIHEGWLDEPANAVSSLAYVAAGAWVWRHDRFRGAGLVALGVGSILYHGFGGNVARWLHDATIGLVLLIVLVSARRIWRGADHRPVVAVCAMVAIALAIPLQLFGRTGGALCRPESVLQAHAVWHVLTAVALACAFSLADQPVSGRPSCPVVSRQCQ